jgi:hypothetical protein
LFPTTLPTASLPYLLVALSLTLAALATSMFPTNTHSVDFMLIE